MRTVGNGHQLPAHANVREDNGEYLIELDVADFTESELTVEALGRRLTVRGDQVETSEDDGEPFRLHEHLEESFRLPDDADVDRDQGLLQARDARDPRTAEAPRVAPAADRAPAYRINPNAEPC